MNTLVVDTECYPNLWAFGARRVSDGKVLVLEHSDRQPLDRERLERLIRHNRVITFNGLGYDMPMIWAAIRGWSVERLKELNDQIIVGRLKWWQVEDVLGFKIPRSDHIDLIEPQPNAVASLKTLNGRLHGRRMQDLPHAPDHVLTPAEREEVLSYLGNDLEATQLLYEALAEPLQLRAAISSDIGVDVRSKSDTQVGFAILKKRVEEAIGDRLGKPAPMAGKKFRYTIPPFIQFQTPELQSLLERIREHEFSVRATGKVELPKFLLDARLQIGPSTFQMGLGGLHSMEANRSVFSDADHVLIDADVGSYYPAIILALGLYPPTMGPKMLPVYAGIRSERMAAKKAGLKTKAESLKISMNGFFGLTSNVYSPAYSPAMTIAITLTGQLSLLMLIERAHLAGISAVSGNTDGVTFLCPRDRANLIAKDRFLPWSEDREISFSSTIKEITDRWERDTGFDLEFVEYRSMHSASVNVYYAIKADGKVKRKGLFANPWNDDKAIREQLMKNPNMTICSDAALAFIKDGIPIEKTVGACVDMRQFVTVVNVQGGGTWNGDYLGKVVRFYWSTEGAPILYKNPHPSTGNFKKASKTDGCRPAMLLPDDLPWDLDYGRYIAEAKEIVRSVGMNPDPAPARRITPELAALLVGVL